MSNRFPKVGSTLSLGVVSSEIKSEIKVVKGKKEQHGSGKFCVQICKKIFFI